MIYLLDTDTLSHLHRGRATAVRRYEAMLPSDVAISVVTKIEMLQARFANVLKAAAAAQLAVAQQRLSETERALQGWHVIDIGAAACMQFDRLRQIESLRKSGGLTCSLLASPWPTTRRWSRATLAISRKCRTCGSRTGWTKTG